MKREPECRIFVVLSATMCFVFPAMSVLAMFKDDWLYRAFVPTYAALVALWFAAFFLLVMPRRKQ